MIRSDFRRSRDVANGQFAFFSRFPKLFGDASHSFLSNGFGAALPISEPSTLPATVSFYQRRDKSNPVIESATGGAELRTW